MCLLRLVALLIFFLLLWKLLSKMNKKSVVRTNKVVESFVENTETFTDPKHMFFKAMTDIKNSDKIIFILF